eukprot:TRINITY_DN17898_c0_g1_i1.p1 TRINITY_DN17898_c0_g1~~TRINITY_DN17898_c0_g1_i1.p1  ORF type:complete len:420 (+),score=18.87 TRINITY_DN17898_c0_g1_i1:91-1350(+)
MPIAFRLVLFLSVVFHGDAQRSLLRSMTESESMNSKPSAPSLVSIHRKLSLSRGNYAPLRWPTDLLDEVPEWALYTNIKYLDGGRHGDTWRSKVGGKDVVVKIFIRPGSDDDDRRPLRVKEWEDSVRDDLREKQDECGWARQFHARDPAHFVACVESMPNKPESLAYNVLLYGGSGLYTLAPRMLDGGLGTLSEVNDLSRELRRLPLHMLRAWEALLRPPAMISDDSGFDEDHILYQASRIRFIDYGDARDCAGDSWTACIGTEHDNEYLLTNGGGQSILRAMFTNEFVLLDNRVRALLLNGIGGQLLKSLVKLRHDDLNGHPHLEWFLNLRSSFWRRTSSRSLLDRARKLGVERLWRERVPHLPKGFLNMVHKVVSIMELGRLPRRSLARDRLEKQHEQVVRSLKTSEYVRALKHATV